MQMHQQWHPACKFRACSIEESLQQPSQVPEHASQRGRGRPSRRTDCDKADIKRCDGAAGAGRQPGRAARPNVHKLCTGTNGWFQSNSSFILIGYLGQSCDSLTRV